VQRVARVLAAAALIGVTGVLALRSLAATPASPAPAPPGQALYAMHCAACHGESGKGDGPSAAGFASKPSNLTEGRRLNRLPAEFFVNVVLNGGPAEGLSPGMPPFQGNLNEGQIRQITAYLRTLADPPFNAEDPRPIVLVQGAPRQPIFFSHLIHAGSYRIDCQYCHADARRSSYAGLPSVQRCMGCHKIVAAQGNPEVQKLHDAAKQNQAIPWVRIHKLAGFVYFPHKRHIQAGLACQTCHGPVERMQRVAQVAPLTMGWCISCHAERKGPLDCVVCHH